MSEITQRYSTGAPQNLEERFASRAAHMKPSEIRSLFAVASRPDFRDVIAEALVIAIQRLYLAAEDDAKTGTLRISDLRKAGIRR